MPKGSTTYTTGGAKRTLICECGKYMVGKPECLRQKFKLHSKVCPLIEDCDRNAFFQRLIKDNNDNVFNWETANPFLADKRTGVRETGIAITHGTNISDPSTTREVNRAGDSDAWVEENGNQI